MKILIFRCTRDVISADKRLKAAGIARRIIPVPRSVSPLCGMAVELEDEKLESAGAVLTGQNGKIAEAKSTQSTPAIEFTVFDRKDVKL